MKKLTSRVTLILGLAMSAAVATTTVNAAENIVNDAIHDYSDDVSRYMQSSPSQRGWGRYDVKIVLDEAYHDYNASDVAAIESPEPALEQTEIAAFEEYSHSLPSVSFTD